MFPPVCPSPQIYPAEGSAHLGHPATGSFIPPMFEDPVLVGNLVYDYLAREANATYEQRFSDWLGHFPAPENPFGNVRYISPASLSGGDATNASNFISPSPSPPLSQGPSTPDHQVSPTPSPTPPPSCRNATAVKVKEGGHRCSSCNKKYTTKHDCFRHIKHFRKEAVCNGCGGRFTGARDDSLRRHLRKFCKGDVANLRFEDAFTYL